MKPYNCLVFDLDGTISDSSPGIVHCFNHALVRNGFPSRPEADIRALIGKGLDESLVILSGVDDPGLIDTMVTDYRARYAEVGYRENTLYPGLVAVLDALDAMPGLILGICTTKKRSFTTKILDLFGIADYFAFTSCGDIGIEKRQQLADLLADKHIDGNALMIGDRWIDVRAARDNGLRGAGVLWGFGDRAELNREKPAHLFARPADILDLF